jgi:hypothetical protein
MKSPQGPIEEEDWWIPDKAWTLLRIEEFFSFLSGIIPWFLKTCRVSLCV